jgi:hypothetical protein
VSYKKQEVLALRVHLNSPKVFDGVRVANTFSFHMKHEPHSNEKRKKGKMHEHKYHSA